MNFSKTTLYAVLFCGINSQVNAFMQLPSKYNSVALKGGLLQDDLVSVIDRQVRTFLICCMLHLYKPIFIEDQYSHILILNVLDGLFRSG
jgi:hypothetical protein